MSMPRPFLTAEWRYLAMLNYEVDPAIVQPFVPPGTELDYEKERTYLSMVGFLFGSTRLLGITVPFHRDFEEVNLRLYVKRFEAGELRRGVTFVRELVPRRAIATIARIAYNERYLAVPMKHRLEFHEAGGDPSKVEYSWKVGRRANHLAVTCTGGPLPLEKGSHEQFIAEHYWGYTAQRGGGSVEYQVAHPPWRIWKATNAELEVDAEELYGNRFAEVLAGKPSSMFVAEGSPVTVYSPRKL